MLSITYSPHKVVKELKIMWVLGTLWWKHNFEKLQSDSSDKFSLHTNYQIYDVSPRRSFSVKIKAAHITCRSYSPESYLCTSTVAKKIVKTLDLLRCKRSWGKNYCIPLKSFSFRFPSITNHADVRFDVNLSLSAFYDHTCKVGRWTFCISNFQTI